MKNFIRTYTYTLVPTAILIIIGFIIFYSTQFSLNKSISLGTLHGFMAAIILNIIPAFVMLDKLKYKSTKSTKSTKTQTLQNRQDLSKKVELKTNEKDTSTNHSLYLLLDFEKSFDLSIDSILRQSLGTILKHDKHRGFISVRAAYQTIDFELKPLTRHTAKVDIKAQKDNETLHSILSYIKNKERSFLNY